MNILPATHAAPMNSVQQTFDGRLRAVLASGADAFAPNTPLGRRYLVGAIYNAAKRPGPGRPRKQKAA